MSRRKIKRKPHTKRLRGAYARRELSPLDVRRRRKKNLELRKQQQAQQETMRRMKQLGVDSITSENLGAGFSLEIEGKAEQGDEQGEEV